MLKRNHSHVLSSQVCHLFVLQGNLGFDGQDQIGCGVSQLADVLIDVAVPRQPHVVVHVPVRRAGRKRLWWGGIIKKINK